jgi:hypothetical protein
VILRDVNTVQNASEKSGEAEKRKARKAEKQKSKTAEKQRNREAKKQEKQKSREAGKAEKQRKQKAEKQKSREAGIQKKPKTDQKKVLKIISPPEFFGLDSGSHRSRQSQLVFGSEVCSFGVLHFDCHQFEAEVRQAELVRGLSCLRLVFPDSPHVVVVIFPGLPRRMKSKPCKACAEPCAKRFKRLSHRPTTLKPSMRTLT